MIAWRRVGALQVDDPALTSSVPPATIAAPTPVHCPSGPRLFAHVMPGARFGKTVGFTGPDLGFLQGCSYLFGLNKTGAMGGSVKHVRRGVSTSTALVCRSAVCAVPGDASALTDPRGRLCLSSQSPLCKGSKWTLKLSELNWLKVRNAALFKFCFPLKLS